MASRTRVFSRLDGIARQAERQAAAAVQKTAQDVEAGAKARSRVDTGAMRNAWQAVPRGPYEAEVVNGVDYAIYHEYGTRHMSAQPMAVPAAEAARDGFERALRRAFE